MQNLVTSWADRRISECTSISSRNMAMRRLENFRSDDNSVKKKYSLCRRHVRTSCIPTALELQNSNEIKVEFSVNAVNRCDVVLMPWHASCAATNLESSLHSEMSNPIHFKTPTTDFGIFWSSDWLFALQLLLVLLNTQF